MIITIIMIIILMIQSQYIPQGIGRYLQKVKNLFAEFGLGFLRKLILE